jgi:hypothetical protein
MHSTYVIKMQSERNVWNLPGNWDGWTRWRWNFCARSVLTGFGDNEDDGQSFCLLPSGNQRKTPSFSFLLSLFQSPLSLPFFFLSLCLLVSFPSLVLSLFFLLPLLGQQRRHIYSLYITVFRKDSLH